MTTCIAAYDTEKPDCLDAVRRIVEVHERFEMPATFFIVARLLDAQGEEYKSLLGGHPLFEIASHTWTHMLLRESRLCGRPGPPEQYEHEIVDSKRRLEDSFAEPVTGFRAPVSFENGLCGAPHLLGLLRRGGYSYSSSTGWGPHDSLPILPGDAFAYADDGYPEIHEIPACGWHENLLKGNNSWDPRPIQLFPHPMPEANISDVVETPGEEFEIHRLFIDRAVSEDRGHVSLIWHPWSLGSFDPSMEMLQLTFQYVRELGLPVSTFAGYAATL